MKRLIIFQLLWLAGMVGEAAAQWVPTNGPPGGSIYPVVIHRHSIIASFSGIIRSDDDGNNWFTANPEFTADILASNGTNIFAVRGGRILRSDDEGITWDSIGLSNIISISVNGQSILAATPCTVFYSSDLGRTWNNLSTAHEFGTICCINFAAIGGNKLIVSKLPAIDSSNRYNPIYYAGTVYFSTNNGAKWDSVYDKLIYSTVEIGNRLMALSSAGLVVYTDSGWQPQTTIPSGLEFNNVSVVGSDLYGVHYGTAIYRSTDAGSNWYVTDTLVSKGRRVFGIVSDAQNIFAPTDDGLFRSTDSGATWEELGIAGADIYHDIVIGSNLYTTGTNGFFLSTDDGETWIFSHTGLGDWSSEVISIGTNLIISTDYGVMRSSDYGVTWRTVSVAMTWAHFYVDDGSVYAVYARQLYRSDDSGATWIQLDTGIGKPGSYLGAIVVNGPIFFLTNFDNEVFGSTDGAKTWISISQLNPNLGAQLEHLYMVGSSLFVTNPFAVYRTDDSGLTWTVIIDGSESQNHLFCFAVANGKPIISNQSGLFISSDNGSHWTNIGDGLRNNVNSLTVKGNYLFAGTSGGGVWKRNLWELDTQLTSKTFSLSAYPNPFSAFATIRYVLSSVGPVSVTITDVIGRIISTPVSGVYQGAGPHEVDIQTKGLSPGAYYCEMTTGNSVQVLKLLVSPE